MANPPINHPASRSFCGMVTKVGDVMGGGCVANRKRTKQQRIGSSETQQNSIDVRYRRR